MDEPIKLMCECLIRWERQMEGGKRGSNLTNFVKLLPRPNFAGLCHFFLAYFSGSFLNLSISAFEQK